MTSLEIKKHLEALIIKAGEELQTLTKDLEDSKVSYSEASNICDLTLSIHKVHDILKSDVWESMDYLEYISAEEKE